MGIERRGEKMKSVKVLLNKNEVDWLLDLFSGEFMRISDEGEEKSPKAKIVNGIYDKIVNGKNKNGMYFLWQLKDREGEVVRENIKDEYLKVFDASQ